MRLNVRSNQAALNKVVKRLNDGRGRAVIAVNDPLACWYRTPKGVPCAVGALIVQASYDPTCERWPVRSLLASGRLTTFPGCDLDLLFALQSVHDDPTNWEGNKFKGWGTIHAVAKEHGLKVNK